MMMYGTEQRRLNDENHRPDVRALPPVAKHLHRRDEPVPPAHRPHARADEEQGQGDDKREDEAIKPNVTTPFANA